MYLDRFFSVLDCSAILDPKANNSKFYIKKVKFGLFMKLQIFQGNIWSCWNKVGSSAKLRGVLLSEQLQNFLKRCPESNRIEKFK